MTLESGIVCCPLSNDGDDQAKVHTVTLVTARKTHRCTECSNVIAKGDRYEHVKGLWDCWLTFRTCLVCAEIRKHFACGGGWTYGDVWQQLADNFFRDMKAGGPCMTGLSPTAKSKLFERRMKWMGD